MSILIYNSLTKNTSAFQNITPINAALIASDRQSVNLLNRGSRHFGYTVIETPLDCPEPDVIGNVDAITIQTIKQQNGNKEIGILKLDIEGSEKALFDINDGSLDDIFAIFVELHDRIIEGCSSSFEVFSRERLIQNFGGEKYLSLRKS